MEPTASLVGHHVLILSELGHPQAGRLNLAFSSNNAEH